MKVTFLIISALLLFGCSSSTNSNSTNAGDSTVSSPQTTPTPTHEEKEKQKEVLREERDKAITDYVTKTHSGWTLQGISNEFSTDSCEEASPCDLHLAKAGKSKVVSVILKHFTRLDGTKYWHVFETRGIDLTQLKIQNIKDQERAATLENLTYEDCEPLTEPPDYDYDPYEDYDPRG